MSHVHVSTHPLVLHHLTRLRDATTPGPEFRRLVRELARLLFADAIRDLPLAAQRVATPLASCDGWRLADSVGIFPILRAGLGMAEALLEALPEARVWHVGLFRDETTALPVTYYNKLPQRLSVDVAFMVDPMLATGGSAVAAIQLLKNGGARRIKFLSLIAAPEGIQALSEAHADVPIYVGAIDSHLNERKFIVPGLGDAGDRQFGT
jgi:uracil phosphoribosyltransferase